MIVVDKASFCYPDGTRALRDVSLDFAVGGMTAVLGANGAGKTTLFRCLLGVLRPQEGRVLLDGRDACSMKRAEIAARIAYVPQRTEGADDLSVLEFVTMGTIRTTGLFSVPGKRQREAAERALSDMGLLDRARKPMGALSGGERQMALIARALAQDAPVLLLDEPVASLDFGNQHRFLQAARELTRGRRRVIFSVHQPQLAMQYADEVIALERGRVVARGGTDRLPDEELIRRLYGVTAKIGEVDGERVLYGTCTDMKE